MKISDAVVGAALVALAIALLVHIQSYPLIPGQKYGPALFPGAIAVGLAIAGALLFARGMRSRAPLLELAPWMRSARALGNFVAVCAALVFYLVASDALGFIPTAALLLLGLFARLGVPLVRAAIVAIVATLAIHALFYKLLRVPLPWGVLERFAW